MFKRVFGLLAFILGAGFGGFILYFMLTGRMHNVDFITRIKMLIMPTVLIAFGVTWMRGETFRGMR